MAKEGGQADTVVSKMSFLAENRDIILAVAGIVFEGLFTVQSILISIRASVRLQNTMDIHECYADHAQADNDQSLASNSHGG